MKKILIVEDEKRIAELLQLHIADMGFLSENVYRGNEALKKILANPYDLILLDIMLPEMDGQEILKRMRLADIATPVIMLTARSEEYDKVRGLEGGADDYITKPIQGKSLACRLLNRLKRSKKQNLVHQ